MNKKKTTKLVDIIIAVVLVGIAAFFGVKNIDSPSATSSSTYDRAAFGPAWKDVDHNGCDTRNDILRRDLTNITVRPGTHGCVIESGVFVDPYTGQKVFFDKKDASQVHIDHIVALKDAWESGADQWNDEMREQFANDPLNLVATTRAPNTSKGAKAADEWMPQTNQCWYATRQAKIKSKYQLEHTPEEESTWQKVCAQ